SRRQAGRTPYASRNPRRSATARQRLECAELPPSAVALLRRTGAPAFARGSWKASFRSCACTGTMNPPLTPPRSGTDRTRTDACSPPGSGRGWVGSWRGSLRRKMDMAVRFNHNFMDAVRNGGEGRPASRPKDLNSSGDLRSSHHLHRAVLRPITRTGMDFLHWPG